MLGKIFDRVYTIEDRSLVFESKYERITLEHYQDCCESVEIEDIVGDLCNLEGNVILMAQEAVSDENEIPIHIIRENSYDDCFQYTFYKFGTMKGYVTVRFFGRE